MVVLLVIFLIICFHPLVPIIVVVICPLLLVLVLSCPIVFLIVAPLLFCCCVLPVFAMPVVSILQTAAHRGGVLVAIIIFASPSLVPAAFPLALDVALFCCCPDP